MWHSAIFSLTHPRRKSKNSFRFVKNWRRMGARKQLQTANRLASLEALMDPHVSVFRSYSTRSLRRKIARQAVFHWTLSPFSSLQIVGVNSHGPVWIRWPHNVSGCIRSLSPTNTSLWKPLQLSHLVVIDHKLHHTTTNIATIFEIHCTPSRTSYYNCASSHRAQSFANGLARTFIAKLTGWRPVADLTRITDSLA